MSSTSEESGEETSGESEYETDDSLTTESEEENETVNDIEAFNLTSVIPNVAKIDFPFTVTIPSNVLNVGPSKSGKSTFIIDLLYNDRIIPRPEMIFLVVGGVSDDKIHASKMDPYLRALYESYHVDSIVNPVSIDDLHEKLGKVDPKIPKLVILDDVMTKDKNDDQICEVATSTMHHNNCIVFYNYQNLFHKTSVILRENAEVLIVWPIPSNRRLNNFFGQYNDVMKKYGPYSLSYRGQQLQDDVSKVMENKELFVPEELRLKSPIIMKRRSPGGRIVVYRGMFDDTPLILEGEVESMVRNDQLVEVAMDFLKKEDEKRSNKRKADDTGLSFVGPKAPCINADVEKLEDAIINDKDLAILERVRKTKERDL